MGGVSGRCINEGISFSSYMTNVDFMLDALSMKDEFITKDKDKHNKH